MLSDKQSDFEESQKDFLKKQIGGMRERHESRITPRFWLNNWKNGVITTETEKKIIGKIDLRDESVLITNSSLCWWWGEILSPPSNAQDISWVSHNSIVTLSTRR